MRSQDAIIARLEQLVTVIGDLTDEFIFVGGSVVPLLVTDKAAQSARVTEDVDVIVNVTSRGKLAIIEERLRAVGFNPDISGDKPVICRHVKDGLILDVMPADETVFGFSNQWYAIAAQNPLSIMLPSSKIIKVINAPVFICTKYDAFDSRGHEDPKDLEDIITLVSARQELVGELLRAPAEVINHVAAKTQIYIASSRYDELEWAVADGRTDVVKARFEKIAKLDLLVVLEQEPTLNSFGFGLTRSAYPSDADYERELVAFRNEMVQEYDVFKMVCAWLQQNAKPRKTINSQMSSYGWKHHVERQIGRYVSNGIFIAAAISCGFNYKKNAPNADFNLATPK
ncbi:MAG: hypothetical protein QG574_5438 [Cyanobacteriota bacterium erpe_2018_sw_21hr_WHONDRS-SW48-000092_B_bin.40]|nr:hypothetical protein [Cyanobacteriota bacterium erpe_2018_sw_21hr_WHONDRS-SW48-000092_B_bin.40]